MRDWCSGLFAMCLGALVLSGCADDAESDYGDWTVQEEDLALTEDLRVSETEAFYFGRIADIAVRDDGQMAVADPEANNVKVLAPDGSLVRVLGQEGEGPGEFQRVRTVQWARGDSLFAFDPAASRLTVFAPSAPHPRERTLAVSREDGFPVRVHAFDARLVVEVSRRVPPSDGEPRYRRVRILRETGVPGDTLFTARRQRSVVISNDGQFMFRPVPFGHESVIARGPDGRLYAGWQDSLHIVAQGLDGSSEVRADVPAPEIPLPNAARDSALAQIENSEMRQAAASAMPETRSAFTDLVVADDGQLWLKRPTEDPDADTAPWWVLDPDAKTIREGQLPAEVDLEVVRDGKVYGTTTTEMRAPALVQYQVVPNT